MRAPLLRKPHIRLFHLLCVLPEHQHVDTSDTPILRLPRCLILQGRQSPGALVVPARLV